MSPLKRSYSLYRCSPAYSNFKVQRNGLKIGRVGVGPQLTGRTESDARIQRPRTPRAGRRAFKTSKSVGKLLVDTLLGNRHPYPVGRYCFATAVWTIDTPLQGDPTSGQRRSFPDNNCDLPWPTEYRLHQRSQADGCSLNNQSIVRVTSAPPKSGWRKRASPWEP